MKFKEHLNKIKTYEAGKPIEEVVRDYGITKVIKLASNENPHGTSPLVQKRVQELLPQMFRYPDDSYYRLKDALSKKFGVKPANLIIGSGSDQIFEFLSRALLSSRSKVLMGKTTFAMYEIYAKQEDAQIIRTKSDKHVLGEFKDLLSTSPDLIYICTPSNPLGDALDAQELNNFLKQVPKETIVVIDAAYIEYAQEKDPTKALDPAKLIKDFANLIYTGTFSKAYGLGGMRVGYAIANENLVQTLSKLRPPFNITTLSLEAAIAALEDKAFVDFCIKDALKEMSLFENFATQNNIEFIDSYTNFITYMFGEKNASLIAQKLLEKGIVVRDLKSYNLNAIRITIGTSSENQELFKALKEVL